MAPIAPAAATPLSHPVTVHTPPLGILRHENADISPTNNSNLYIDREVPEH